MKFGVNTWVWTSPLTTTELEKLAPLVAGVSFDWIEVPLKRMNEMEVFWVGEEPKETQGFHNVLFSEGYHSFWSNWWPHGHIIGWEHTFVHEIHHLLDAIVNDKSIAPYGADFLDGYKNAVICDGILESARSKRQVDLKY